jgi:hypothetical protein
MMKKIIYLLVMSIIPVSMFADSFTSLWKKVAEAESKDLPKTQIKWLERIISKAEKEKTYGQLLKAQLRCATVQTQVSPDSLETETERLEQKAQAAQDDVLRAVYAAVLGKVYQMQDGEVAKAKSKAWFAKAMANPALLAEHKSTEYEPAVISGIDSRIFYDDLLHVIGLEAEDYSTLRDYYAKRGNRAAECITALYELRQNRRMDATRMRKSEYVQAVDSLINIYGDLREAGELAIERYNCMSYYIDVSAEDRINYINYALSRWGAWPQMNILRNAQRDLQQPSFNINIGDYMLLPNSKRQIRINSIRNINELYVNIYRLNVNGDTELNPSRKEDYAKLQKLILPGTVQSVTRRYIGQPAWKENSDSITLKGLPVGVYLMEATTDNNDIAPQRTLLRVSNLYVMHEGLPDKKIRFVVVNATTGKPVPNARIVLSDRSYNGNVSKKTNLTSDKNGETVYRYDKHRPSEIYVYTDEDRACGNLDIDGYYFFGEDKTSRNFINVFTDRSIYRPGQTVHASVIAYRADNKAATSNAIGNHSLTFTLYDANDKEVTKKNTTTDSYGQASVVMPLPQNGLTGIFQLRVSGNQLYGNTYIQVEQYKRPTFQVKFDDYKQTYQPGDTVQMRGVAKSFAGVPVQGAKVEYTVERQRSVWWRWGYNDDAPILLTDTAVTADDGSFTVRMPMEFPDDVETDRPLYYRVVANAKVTDTAGETHEASTALPLSNRSSILTCDMPDKSLRDSLKTFTFTRKNIVGQDITGTIRYRIDEGAWKTVEANTPVVINKKMASGRHRLIGICENDTVTHDFVVFSYSDKEPAVETHDWFYVSDNMFRNDGKPVYLQLGSSDEDVHVYYSVFSENRELARGSKMLNNEVHTEKLVYKESYGNGILISLAWVKHGRLYTHQVSLSRPEPKREMTLAWKTFRDKLTPGQKEEWTLQILGPDGKPAKAQLLCTMYDKSLDDIAEHRWYFSPDYRFPMPYSNWIGGSRSAIGLYGFQSYKALPERSLDFSHFSEDMFAFASPYMFLTRAGAIADAAVPGVRTHGTNATAKKMLMADAVDKNVALDYEIAASRPAVAEEVFAAAQESANNKGTNTATQIRENLNETAFFYPALTTDAEGNVAIRFTLPESVTTWNFMGIAHDEQINYGMITADAVAKKDVMVQPNVPRFIRVGDKAQINSRIINTSDKPTVGTAKLQLLDPETETVISEWSKPFSIESGKTGNVSFDVDGDQLASLAHGTTLFIARITAEGKGFSDGEQHYLPLLPNREYITTTVPFTQHGAGTKTIDLGKLFPDNDAQNKLTVEYTNNPAWLMIQALPSIANPYDKDAISLASAIYANSIGRSLIQSSPKIGQTIKLWQMETGKETSLMSNLQKNEDLKTMVLSETPWVADAEKETDQKQQLISFLDESMIDYRISEFTNKLQELQNSDGSFSWWPGMCGSSYMTIAVVKMLTRLDAMTGTRYTASPWLNKAFAYLDLRIAEEVTELKKQEKKGQKELTPSEMACNYLYASALAKRKTTNDMNWLVGLLEKSPTALTIYGKAGSAVILSQYGKKQRAREYLQSISEYSVYKEEMGRYFDTPHALYSWFDYKIPTQVAAIEAMKMLNTTDSKIVEDMQRWLLQQKRTTGWDTPLNATDAVYAFLADGNGKVDMSKLVSGTQTTLTIDGKALNLPRTTAGIGYVKTSVQAPNASTFTAQKTSEGTSWGALYAQFWQKSSDVKSASSGLVVNREIRSADGKKTAERLKVGDKVKVRITITADRDYDFVQVQDKRAACLEPVGQLSGYHWGYYCAPGDNVTNYYFDQLAKGTHVIETEYYVDREGDYATGICTAQCAYSPEFSAREAAKTLKVGQ